MRETVSVRISKSKHVQIAEVADKYQVSITMLLDLAVAHLLRSGRDFDTIISVLKAGYEETLERLVTENFSKGAPSFKGSSSPVVPATPIVKSPQEDLDELIDTIASATSTVVKVDQKIQQQPDLCNLLDGDEEL